MMILFEIVSAPVEIRLNVVPVLSLTVAEPSEVATVPTSSTPALTMIVPAMPGLAAVRTRLPPPSLVKPLVATKTELMKLLPPVHAPTLPVCAAMTGEIGRLLPSKPASSVIAVPPEIVLPSRPNMSPPSVTPKPAPNVN